MKVAADSEGLVEVADSLGDLVKQMATDIATQVRERLRCANIARAFAEEAWAIYKGRAPETGDMNS
jgi:hypothetical protein